MFHRIDEPPHDRFIELPGRGTTWVLDRPGPRRRAPVALLLHGWRATAASNWEPVVDQLGRTHRVVALDHRGHGRGIRSRDRFALEDCADDAAALLRELRIDRAVVAGYSMGGPVAQLLWQRHRPLVAGLVFCATTHDFRVAHPALIAAAQDLERAFHTMPRVLRAAGMRMVAARVAPDDQRRSMLLDDFDQQDERAIRQAGWAIGRFRSTSWIGEVDVPSAVVVTARDAIVEPARQRELAAQLPGARVRSIDAGHLVCVGQPELFGEAMTDAVRLVTPTRRAQWLRGRLGSGPQAKSAGSGSWVMAQ